MSLSSFARQTNGHSSKEHWIERAKVLDGFHSPAIATETLLAAENLSGYSWEPANGYSRISNILRAQGHKVFTSDIKRWHSGTDCIRDFLSCPCLPRCFKQTGSDLITNPPYKLADSFVQHAMNILPRGNKCCLLLRLQFLEGNKRNAFFERYPPRRIHVYSFRLPRMHRFGYDGVDGGSTMCFAWFVWISGYKGPTELKWIKRPKGWRGESV